MVNISVSVHFAQAFSDRGVQAQCVLDLLRHRDFQDQKYKGMDIHSLRFIAKGLGLKGEKTKVAVKDSLVSQSCHVLNVKHDGNKRDSRCSVRLKTMKSTREIFKETCNMTDKLHCFSCCHDMLQVLHNSMQ